MYEVSANSNIRKLFSLHICDVAWIQRSNFEIPTGLISVQVGKPQSPVKPVSLVATVSKSGPSPGKRPGSSPPDPLRNVWSRTRVPVLVSFGDTQTWLGWAELSCSFHVLSISYHREKGAGKAYISLCSIRQWLWLHCNKVLELISFICFHFANPLHQAQKTKFIN